MTSDKMSDHRLSGPEGTLSALGCAAFLIAVGFVLGVVASAVYVGWMSQ